VLGPLRWFLERNNAHGAGVLACTPANITGGLEVSVTLKAQALELTKTREFCAVIKLRLFSVLSSWFIKKTCNATPN
jgi:hypothetical protein